MTSRWCNVRLGQQARQLTTLSSLVRRATKPYRSMVSGITDGSDRRAPVNSALHASSQSNCLPVSVRPSVWSVGRSVGQRSIRPKTTAEQMALNARPCLRTGSDCDAPLLITSITSTNTLTHTHTLTICLSYRILS